VAARARGNEMSNGMGLMIQVDNPVDETADQLRTISESGNHPSGEGVTKELQKRKLITPK